MSSLHQGPTIDSTEHTPTDGEISKWGSNLWGLVLTHEGTVEGRNCMRGQISNTLVLETHHIASICITGSQIYV